MKIPIYPGVITRFSLFKDHLFPFRLPHSSSVFPRFIFIHNSGYQLFCLSLQLVWWKTCSLRVSLMKKWRCPVSSPLSMTPFCTVSLPDYTAKTRWCTVYALKCARGHTRTRKQLFMLNLHFKVYFTDDLKGTEHSLIEHFTHEPLVMHLYISTQQWQETVKLLSSLGSLQSGT